MKTIQLITLGIVCGIATFGIGRIATKTYLANSAIRSELQSSEPDWREQQRRERDHERIKRAERFIDALGATEDYYKFLDDPVPPQPVAQPVDDSLPPPIDNSPKMRWYLVGPFGTIGFDSKNEAIAALKDHEDAAHIFGATEHMGVLR